MAELSNGARWQDGVDKRLEQNTDALNALALKMQQQIDRLDCVLKDNEDFRKQLNDHGRALDEQGRFIDKAKWSMGLVALFVAYAWDVAKSWLSR